MNQPRKNCSQWIRSRALIFAPVFLALALAFGFFSTEVAQAHFTTTTIYSYYNSVTTGHTNNSFIDEACGSTYRLTNKSYFNEVTDDDVDVAKFESTSKNYTGTPTGGTYRLGNYNNQTMKISYFMLNTNLEDGVTYVLANINKTIPYAWDNQVVVTLYSYAGSGFACQNIDWDFFYPDE